MYYLHRMKTLFLSILLSICSIQSKAQSFEIHDLQGNNVTGSSQFITGDACSSLACSYYVINTSSVAKTIKAYRNEISLVSGSDNAITFDLNMYVPTIDTSVMSSTVQPGDSVFFQGDYFPNCNIGNSIIQYCFFDVNAPADLSCVGVTFSGVVVGISETNTLQINSISAFPNPSDAIVHFDFPFVLNDQTQVVLTDISGRNIQFVFSDLNYSEINFSNYPNGFYLLSVWSSDGSRAIGKIQILHN